MIMARGYRIEDIRQKMIEIFRESNNGMSGIEISEKIGINRITMSKYLKIFAAEGFVHQKDIGNVTLWFLEPGQESYDFPADYFKVTPLYLDTLLKYSESQVFALLRNCIHSGASVSKLVTEVIIPAINTVKTMYDDGKLGSSEEKLLQNIISKSLQIFNQLPIESDNKKNVIVISADSQTSLIAEAAATSFYLNGCQVFHLGDMSSAINVLFDLDLQKLLGKIWKQKSGILVIVVFSETEEGLNFFADSVNSVKEKLGKKIRLVLCGKVGKKTRIQSDLLTTKFEDVLQWSQTILESSK